LNPILRRLTSTAKITMTSTVIGVRDAGRGNSEETGS
jgi:hypothetical protein